MKKKILPGLLAASCILALAGCGRKAAQEGNPAGSSPPARTESSVEDPTDDETMEKEDTEILPDSADAEEEGALRGELAARLPFSAGDDKICAILYLGKGEEKQQENLKAFFEKYVPEYTLEQIAALPASKKEGEEAYLIIPRYEACSLSVTRLEKQEAGGVKVLEDAEQFQGAFLLYCNPSQDFYNAEVNIAYKAKVHIIVPKLSPPDNRLEPMQPALDLTDEAAYQ